MFVIDRAGQMNERIIINSIISVFSVCKYEHAIQSTKLKFESDYLTVSGCDGCKNELLNFSKKTVKIFEFSFEVLIVIFIGICHAA